MGRERWAWRPSPACTAGGGGQGWVERWGQLRVLLLLVQLGEVTGDGQREVGATRHPSPASSAGGGDQGWVKMRDVVFLLEGEVIERVKFLNLFQFWRADISV